MFNKILVPVDLGHLDKLARALSAAAEMAKSHNAGIVYAGVYGNVPRADLPSPEDYADALEAFAERQGANQRITTASLPIFSHDPEAELTSALLTAAGDIGADVIVMASHVPGWKEHIFHSNAGYVASHATVSVFVVR
ncbi:universal stress protein [Pelagibius sp. Alg239-R121]|uniref:universal stress protein n=1 Tax=Pelagibius sp. Alg239-R121 TaxID=2993448 RepID=UPI0024A60FFC|nr:universal stress protein [Pelagibius sp. Alg239-R121]